MDTTPAQKRRPRVRRIGALVLLAVTIGAGLAVHLLLPDTAATDIAADALYALAAYLVAVVLAPRWPSAALGAISAAWCVGVEFFQLTEIPLELGARFMPAMLVLGTVFEWRDLLVYVVTIRVATLVDAVSRWAVARRARDSSPA